MQGGGFRDRAPEFEAANAVIVGASFDTVEEQKQFADEQNFPYSLISDPERIAGTAFDAVREEGEDYFEFGLPRRISYLISPDGVITKAYDLAGKDLSEHAAEVLADIAAAG
ncbi:MAG: peroxiredoxin [Actinomycetia bacterium]|nr:peroxiredoxin [Actinomycetes bacterium]